jgi:hypothetical protein
MVAVDGKIEEQRKFYAWWKANVTGQGTRTDLSRERGQSLAQSDAEDLTGMKHQRVSPFSFENDDFLYDAHPNLAAPTLDGQSKFPLELKLGRCVGERSYVPLLGDV